MSFLQFRSLRRHLGIGELFIIRRLFTAQSDGCDAFLPKFLNRNPRNLEMMGIAKKRKGWNYQYPPKDFYHQVLFEKTNRYITGSIQHSSGKIVAQASTKEFSIAQFLHSYCDVSAAENIGHVLAQRSIETGILNAFILDQKYNSEKFSAFRSALLSGGLELSEPPEVCPEYEPGINYDNQEEMEDLKHRQRLANVPSPYIMKKRRRIKLKSF